MSQESNLNAVVLQNVYIYIYHWISLYLSRIIPFYEQSFKNYNKIRQMVDLENDR